ncbi:plastocyanin/azurin family copper-binding protein [Bosea sp. BK604]|uniref:cupredoxin domain-containing protein n=1 Tax=Bosea sp. BK604 TaxID=2512180 RepID=UPI00104C4934|nr:plastocyanin/azurin family copper-binding protein [Bosea sp. BK604]TCR64152.1 plastocyanin [Bosea sp. BK604]
MTRTGVFVAALLAAGTIALSPALAKEFTVTQKGQQFTPRTLTLKVGDEIVFINDDTGTHNVFSESPGNAFDLKAQRPGSKTNVTFSAAGQVDVRCAIHPTMRLSVTVE